MSLLPCRVCGGGLIDGATATHAPACGVWIAAKRRRDRRTAEVQRIEAAALKRGEALGAARASAVLPAVLTLGSPEARREAERAALDQIAAANAHAEACAAEARAFEATVVAWRPVVRAALAAVSASEAVTDAAGGEWTDAALAKVNAAMKGFRDALDALEAAVRALPPEARP